MHLFLSYRRSDAQSAARQLAEALERRLGDDIVFFDVADIQLGEEWLEKIRDKVEAADVFLAVIGPHWLDVLDERSRRMRRDDRDEDVMRLEIETFELSAMIQDVASGAQLLAAQNGNVLDVRCVRRTGRGLLSRQASPDLCRLRRRWRL